MKRILKFLGIGLGALIALSLLAALYINFGSPPNYQEEFALQELAVDITAERVQTGAELSSVLCNHCHGDKGRLQGKFVAVEEGFGPIHASNITQDPEFGIGKYTDAELYRLLRTGIKKDGSLALPMMMRFPTAADEEIYSMIAYLRSEKPEVQPSQKKIPAYEPSFLVKMLSKFVFEPFPMPQTEILRPAPNDPTYGFYLANSVYACYDCHSASFQTNDFLEPEESAGFMAGGNPISVGDMEPIVSANITMHKEGIGGWTADQFLTALKYGKKPDGITFQYPMLPYSFLDSTEIYAIFDYIQSIPAKTQEELAYMDN